MKPQGYGFELTAGVVAALFGVLALVGLWGPPIGPPAVALGLDALAALILGLFFLLAVRARLEFVRPGGLEQAHTPAGAIAIGVVFVLLLVGLSGGVLYALAAKHGIYQPFDAPPTRLGALLLLVNEALKGALFDVLDVFGLNLPGAPSYDARANWGLGLFATLVRFAAAFAVWSLVFAILSTRGRPRRCR